MRQCRRSDLHPGWDLANRYQDTNFYNHSYSAAFGYTNTDQDSRLSNIHSGCAVSYTNGSGSTSDSVANLAIAWPSGANDRDRVS